MNNLLEIIAVTSEIPVWFMADQTDEVYSSIVAGGVNSLRDYAQKCISESGVEVDLSLVDWEATYLIVRDWHKRGLSNYAPKIVTCEYLGVDHEELDIDSEPSAERIAKTFGGDKTVAEVATITDIPEKTLNDWFDRKKIAFYCAIEFAAATVVSQ